MPKPHKGQIETASIDHSTDETSDRIVRTYIRLGALLERHKAQIEKDAKEGSNEQQTK
jgi:hypothetical protein